MQFTVLIEFLVPGLTTTLLALAMLPDKALPQLPQVIPMGDTGSTLLLLAISYPVGILINFAIFKVQRLLINPPIRREILGKFKSQGKDLIALCNEVFEMRIGKEPATPEELRDIFDGMKDLVFSKNVERFSQSHLFHEGLQRFSRGMLMPLLMAVAWVWHNQSTARFLPVGIFGLLLAFALWLLSHSIRTDDEQAARFFVLLTRGSSVQQVSESRPTLASTGRPASPSAR
jgi:hypothetical protein